MFVIVTTPDRFPHRCRSCGSGSEASGREWFVDLGEVDNQPGDGPGRETIYFCNLCLGALAVQQGFATPEQTVDLDSKIMSLEGDLFDARVKADGLEQGLNGLLRARFVDAADAPELVSVLEGFRPLAEGSQANGRLLDLGTGALVEPSDVEGVGDLRSDDIADASSPDS